MKADGTVSVARCSHVSMSAVMVPSMAMFCHEKYSLLLFGLKKLISKRSFEHPKGNNFSENKFSGKSFFQLWMQRILEKRSLSLVRRATTVRIIIDRTNVIGIEELLTVSITKADNKFSM